MKIYVQVSMVDNGYKMDHNHSPKPYVDETLK